MTRMMAIALPQKAACVIALALSCGATVTQASCPDRDDLGGGIALIRSEPFYSNIMTATGNGLTEARVMARDGEAEDVSSTYSHGLTVTERISANGTLALVHDDDTSILDQLAQIG